MKLRYLSLIMISIFIASLFSHQEYVHGNIAQAPSGNTGAPGETTCNQSSCHNSSSTVTNSPDITLKNVFTNDSLPSYTPGTQYNLVVTLNGAARYGFQITALDASNNQAGTFALGNGTNANRESLTNSGGRQYMGHKNADSNPAWVFFWTAPATNVGPVSFYLSGDKADADSTAAGDIIHLRKYVIPAAGGGGCSSFSASISGSSTLCAGGSEVLTASSLNGTGSNSYLWSGSGSTSSQITATATGTYTVAVTNGACSATASLTVSAAPAGNTAFSVTPSGTTVTITNSSSNVAAYEWTFGDGDTTQDAAASFTHVYNTAGVYTITVIGVDECGNTTTATHNVTVTGSVGINSVTNSTGVTIFPNPVQDQINITVNGQGGNYNLVIYDIAGKVVRSAEGAAGSTIQLDRNGLDKGMYIYNVKVDGKSTTGKMLVN